jgi:hypothetical protein
MPDNQPDERDRVTIIAVGVWQYQHLRQLTGPELDLRNLKAILVDDPELALFETRQYRELVNPTSDQLRQTINQYVHDRGADNDILLFYFSGHGAAIGNSDFAFCTKDTMYLTEEHTILPMTAVSFTEILRTLWIKKVTPVFVIDACFSGMAGGALVAIIGQLIGELQGEIQRRYASSYALFCSAPNDQEVLDNPNGEGGLLSTSLVELAEEGLEAYDRRSPTIFFTDLYPHLRRKVEASGISPIPMLMLGHTLPSFSVFKNIDFSPLEYRLQPHLIAVLRALWNHGNPRELRPRDIADITGLKGAYGNHRKLSFGPWNLVETVGGSRRRLNDRGIAFMQGLLQVPRDIISDERRFVYTEKIGTDMIGIDGFVE